MRIVHTSDWHAGRHLRYVSRLEELAAALDELARFVERERVDLLLMSGDVFDSANPPSDAERVVFEFFKRVGMSGAQMVVVAGNHDSPARLQAWGTLAELANVRVVAKPARSEEGGVIELMTRSGERAVIAAVPFAQPGTFIRALELVEPEPHIRQRYAHGVQQIIRHLSARFRADTVNLLIAHVLIEGARLSGSEREVHVGEEWAVPTQALPHQAHYAALGHVHKPQKVPRSPLPAEYAGSVLQLDFSEAGEEKSFVFIPEAVPGRPIHPERVPYQGGKPLLDVRVETLGELERRIPELRGRGWVRVTVRLSEPDPDIAAKVRRLLPETVAIRVEDPRTGRREDTPDAVERPTGPKELYQTYYRRHYGAEPPDDLLEAFEQIYQRILEEET